MYQRVIRFFFFGRGLEPKAPSSNSFPDINYASHAHGHVEVTFENLLRQPSITQTGRSFAENINTIATTVSRVSMHLLYAVIAVLSSIVGEVVAQEGKFMTPPEQRFTLR